MCVQTFEKSQISAQTFKLNISLSERTISLIRTLAISHGNHAENGNGVEIHCSYIPHKFHSHPLPLPWNQTKAGNGLKKPLLKTLNWYTKGCFLLFSMVLTFRISLKKSSRMAASHLQKSRKRHIINFYRDLPSLGGGKCAFYGISKNPEKRI